MTTEASACDDLRSPRSLTDFWNGEEMIKLAGESGKKRTEIGFRVSFFLSFSLTVRTEESVSAVILRE